MRHVVEHKIKGDRSAIKSHRAPEFYLRERAAYEPLSIYLLDVSPSNITFPD